MKSIKYLLGELKKDRQFKRIKEYDINREIHALLPHKFKRHIMFSSVKNGTILIAFNNHILSKEFNDHYKQVIDKHLELIRIKYKDYPKFNNLFFSKGYTPLNLLEQQKRESTKMIKKLYYRERAKGDFHISPNNFYYDMFEQLRKVIKQNLLYDECNK